VLPLFKILGGKKNGEGKVNIFNVNLDVVLIDITPNIMHHWNCSCD
jgi:hypothetical protein